MWCGGVAAVVKVVSVGVVGVRGDVRWQCLRFFFLWSEGTVPLLRHGAGVGGWGWQGGGSRIGMSSVGIGRMWVMWEAGFQ